MTTDIVPLLNDSVMDRFWVKVDKSGDCWNWVAQISTKGYGRFKIGESSLQAHRVSWVWANQREPDLDTLDHLCRNRRCVNPDHLEPKTSRDNTLAGDTIAARFAARERCPKGHEWTVTPGQKGRYCSPCAVARVAAFRQKRRVE